MSDSAALALESFARLHVFFGRDAPLAAVLGWDEATVACWRRREVVRPQSKKADQVVLLLKLCDEARPHLHDDLQVGRWLGTAQPNLRGVSPAQWLAANGHYGLKGLSHGLTAWKPIPPVLTTEQPIASDLGEKLLLAVAEWEAEHGPLTPQELAVANAVLDVAGVEDAP